MEEKEMSFWGHLEELRRTLFRVVAVLLVFMIACFCVMPDLFDSFVLGPTTSDFFPLPVAVEPGRYGDVPSRFQQR